MYYYCRSRHFELFQSYLNVLGALILSLHTTKFGLSAMKKKPSLLILPTKSRSSHQSSSKCSRYSISMMKKHIAATYEAKRVFVAIAMIFSLQLRCKLNCRCIDV